jgi:hypothetical protein
MKRTTLGAMLLLLFAAPATAERDQNERWCAGEDGATADQKIAGCSAIITVGTADIAAGKKIKLWVVEEFGRCGIKEP